MSMNNFFSVFLLAIGGCRVFVFLHSAWLLTIFCGCLLCNASPIAMRFSFGTLYGISQPGDSIYPVLPPISTSFKASVAHSSSVPLRKIFTRLIRIFNEHKSDPVVARMGFKTLLQQKLPPFITSCSEWL